MAWIQETIDDYHLNQSVLSRFLKDKFGNYDFKIKVGQPIMSLRRLRCLTWTSAWQ